MDDAGYQLTKVLEDMPENALDKKVTSGSMSPREQVAHLCEAYEAFRVNAGGGKYEWGSYETPSTETAALMNEFKSQRAKAVDKALACSTPEEIKHAHEFIVGHDYYHVGQMCLARLEVQPEWDGHAIYRG